MSVGLVSRPIRLVVDRLVLSQVAGVQFSYRVCYNVIHE